MRASRGAALLAQVLLFAAFFYASSSPASIGGAAQSGTKALLSAASKIDRAAAHPTSLPSVTLQTAGPSSRRAVSLDTWLQAALRSAARAQRKTRAKRLNDIGAALRELARQNSTVDRAIAPRADVARATAAILSDPAYRVQSAPPPAREPTLWERIANWLWRQFDAIFGGLARAATGVPALGTILAALLVAAAVAALGYAAYRIAAAFASRARVTTLPGEPLERSIDFEALYRAAAERAQDKEFGHAVRLLFLAALVALERRWRVPFDSSRTAGEYRRLVRRSAPPASEAFDLLARVFTLTAYAEVPLSEPDWLAALASYRALAPAA